MRWRTLALVTAVALGGCEATTDGGAAAGGSEVALTTGNSKVKDGGKFWTPMDNGTSTVALFSEQKDIWTFRNDTSAAVTIDSITITPDTGMAAEEFQVYDNAIPSKPTTVSGVQVPAGGTYLFQIRFFPVAGGERKATVTVGYDGGKKLTFGLTGKGQTEARFFTKGTISWQKVAGTAKADELTGAGIVGPDGTTYYTANASEVIDTFSTDLIIGAVDKDGKAVWTKVWNGEFRDQSPDAGQNAETGGTADSMVLGADGSLYVVGAASPIKQNNQFAATVLKIDPKTGDLKWKKAFKPIDKYSTASHNAVGYSIDASGSTVIVTGTTEGDSKVLLFALDPATGDLKGALAVEVQKTYNDRGYAVRRDGKGGVYVGGNAASYPFLMHLTGADTGVPVIDWVQQIELGKGSGLVGLDVDADGNAYLAMDRRGAITAFSAGKVDLTGKVLWTKTWNGNGKDRSNTHLVRVFGSTLIVGGRQGIPNFDTEQGDAGVVALSTADGALQWSSFHYSGKGTDEIAEHRIKGVGLVGKTLTLVTQVYTGKDNGVRYAGYWYDGIGDVVDETVTTKSLAGVTMDQIKTAVVVDAGDIGSGKWVDAPATWLVQDASAKHDGKSPDADVMLTRIDLN